MHTEQRSHLQIFIGQPLALSDIQHPNQADGINKINQSIDSSYVESIAELSVTVRRDEWDRLRLSMLAEKSDWGHKCSICEQTKNSSMYTYIQSHYEQRKQWYDGGLQEMAETGNFMHLISIVQMQAYKCDGGYRMYFCSKNSCYTSKYYIMWQIRRYFPIKHLRSLIM